MNYVFLLLHDSEKWLLSVRRHIFPSSITVETEMLYLDVASKKGMQGKEDVSEIPHLIEVTAFYFRFT